MNFPFDQEIILENERVQLRPMELRDAEHLLQAALSDTDLLQYSPRPINTPDLLKQYVERALDLRRGGKRYTFTVFDKRASAYAGSTSFLNIANEDDRLEIGATWYGKAFQRTGLNRNCKFLLLQYAFETLGAQRVELRTDERNMASRTAIEKIGGRFEGTLRSHMMMHDGFRRNTVCYGILKAEWEAGKERLQAGLPCRKDSIHPA
jgi:RimJ/RimL family protein N-acetyltransferase